MVSIRIKMKIRQKHNDGLIAYLLGGAPTILQKVLFFLMAFSLILWPLGIFISIFFFDAPIRFDMDKICRYGMLLTIWLYPIYLFPLLRLFFYLSKRLKTAWLFYFSPIVPMILFLSFFSNSTISTQQTGKTESYTNKDLFGHWILNGGEKQINYPEIEFFKDSTAVLYSKADTLYRFTYFVRNDSLHLRDIEGKQYVNRISKVDSTTIMFEGLAEVGLIQVYHK